MPLEETKEREITPEEILTSVQNKECIMCHNDTNTKEAFVCLQCREYCSPVYQWINKSESLVDVKSSCCNYDVEVMSRLTCSEECHKKFVQTMENQHGKTKKGFKPFSIMSRVGTSYVTPDSRSVKKTYKNILYGTSQS